MGGKALAASGVDSVRLDAGEYTKETNKLLSAFGAEYPEAKFVLVPAYANKQDFGDADVLVSCDLQVWEKLLKGKMDAPHYKNGKVFSYGQKTEAGEYFQVDLIYCGNTDAELTTELHYYGFNDLGNLVGRLAHLLGLKYGHKGLTYMLRDPMCNQQVVGELSVTRDTKTIHELLGLNHERFLQGFAGLEDIFKWIAESKYFHPRIYLLENVNAVSRVRDAKRKTYNSFLEWSGALDATQYVEYVGDAKTALRNHIVYSLLNSHPEFAKQYTADMAQFFRWNLGKQFFSGDLVKELTGLSGKELGVFMKHIKEVLTTDAILANPNKVKETVMAEFAKLTK